MHARQRALFFLLTLVSLAVSAQQITGVRVEPAQAAVGQAVTITIDFGARGGGFACGLSVAFGDGGTQDVRVSENEVPLKITHTYSAPGNYSVAASGKLVMRGLRSALPCDGSVRSAAIPVLVPGAAVPSVAMPPQPVVPSAPVAGGSLQGIFSLRAVHSGKCLDVTGPSQANGANIYQWDCHGGDNQRWRFIPRGGDWYSLAAVHSNKCLDVEGIRRENGVNVSQYECHGGDNQVWRVTPEGGGVYRLTARHSGKCLDVAGAGRNNADNVQQWDCHAGDNQKWRIDVSGAQPSAPVAAPQTPASCVSEAALYTNNNPAGVSNNPTQPTRFRLDADVRLSYLLTYHWNNGRGQPPGTIGLQHQDGTRYGPWQASGAPGQGGVPNAYWIVRPQVVLKPGIYTVLDSDPASWAQNGQSGGQGIVDLKGCSASR